MNYSPDTFVLIIGPPRTGTSLMVDLVKRCGYNFGNLTTPKDSRPRMGERSPRNEHRNTMKGKLPNHPENKIKEFKHAEINGNKIVNAFHKWIPFFASSYKDLRVIVMRRKPGNGLKSTKEISESWGDKQRKQFWMNRRKWAQEIADSNEYNTLVVDFELLLKKDENLLQSIINFVGGEISPAALKSMIDPGVSKNK